MQKHTLEAKTGDNRYIANSPYSHRPNTNRRLPSTIHNAPLHRAPPFALALFMVVHDAPAGYYDMIVLAWCASGCCCGCCSL